MKFHVLPAAAIACLLIAAPNPAQAAAQPGSIVVAAVAESPQQLYERALAMDGSEAPDKEAKAVKLYRQAAERGHGEAMYQLAFSLSLKYGKVYNRPEALKWARAAVVALAGNPEQLATATSHLADVLRDGGTLADAQEALALLERLAVADPVHYVTIGSTWDQGIDGVLLADQAKATAYIRKAAEAGNSTGMTNLADRLVEGKGVAADAAEAVRWYQKAVEASDGTAVRGLVKLLRVGAPGVAPNPAEAMAWAKKAAGLDLTIGYTLVGEMYEEGVGAPQDYKAARTWLRLAYDKDYAPFPARLAQLHEKGLGGPVDKVMAYALLKNSAWGDEDVTNAKRLYASFDKPTRKRADAAAEKLKKK